MEMMYMIPEDNYLEALKILIEAYCEARKKGNYEMAKLTYEVYELLTAEKNKVKDAEKADLQSSYLEETESRLDDSIKDPTKDPEFTKSCLQAYKNIIATGGCNECAIRAMCNKRPDWGKLVRYNCIYFRRDNNE